MHISWAQGQRATRHNPNVASDGEFFILLVGETLVSDIVRAG